MARIWSSVGRSLAADVTGTGVGADVGLGGGVAAVASARARPVRIATHANTDIRRRSRLMGSPVHGGANSVLILRGRLPECNGLEPHAHRASLKSGLIQARSV